MADCYRYLGPKERFRAIAYENVSRVLSNMKEDIAEHAQSVQSLDEVGSIGESIAEKIIEYLKTGRITTFEKLKKQVPFELLDLMDISGFGPATVKQLYTGLSVQNKDDLINALRENKLAGLRNLGPKKIDNMMRALKIHPGKKRLPLRKASSIAKDILKEIRQMKGVMKAEIAGSIRRKKETIGDIDIIIIADISKRKSIVNSFTKLKEVKRILAAGSTKASVIWNKEDVQVDIRLVHDYEYGAAMLYFTGSKEHNINLRLMAKEKGYKINEYGLFDMRTHKRLAGENEEGMYHMLGMNYIPPEKRSNEGEIEKAMIK